MRERIAMILGSFCENRLAEIKDDYSFLKTKICEMTRIKMWQKTKEVQLALLFTEEGKEKMLEEKIHTVDDIITNYLNFDRNLDITVPLRQ